MAVLAGGRLEVEATGVVTADFLFPKIEKKAVGAGRFGAVLAAGVLVEGTFEVVLDWVAAGRTFGFVFCTNSEATAASDPSSDDSTIGAAFFFFFC